MMLGRCCKCNEVKVVTIKGLTASTGVTEWEYGPGSLWAQHYGADRISGIQNNSAASLNRYCEIAPRQFSFYGNGPFRTAGAITANSKQALTLVKLNSTDGTVVESAVMQGLFSYNPSGVPNAYQLFNVRIDSPIGLSGGDYGFKGWIDPTIEWVDYTTNTTNKEYIFHAHTLSGGNVYLRTKTSSEIVTLPYNATAAQTKTLLEATANVVTATVTGGPWPRVKMNVDIVWSVATGDFAGQRSDVSYTVSTPNSCLYRWDATMLAWVLVSDNCAMGGAMPPVGTGSYDGELREGTCPVPYPPLPTVTRQTQAVAVVFSTSTGLMTSFVEARFGLVNGSFASRLIPDGGATVQGTTKIANNSFGQWAAGPSNSVIVIGGSGSAGVFSSDARTVEAWTVADPWTRIWQRYANGALVAGDYAWLSTSMVQSGKIAVNVARTLYSGATKTGTIADITAGTFTPFDEDEVSTDSVYNNFAAGSELIDGSTTARMTSAYSRRFPAPNFSSRIIEFNLGGSQYRTSSKRLLLGIEYLSFGADSSRIYGSRLWAGGTASATAIERNIRNTSPPPSSGAATAGSISRTYRWRFYTEPRERNIRNTSPPPSSGASYAGSISRTYRWRFYTEPRERYLSGDWRLVFRRTQGSGDIEKRTAWMTWGCTAATVATEVLAVFPENTEGVVSNVRVNPLGATNVTDNSPTIGLIEANLDLFFQAHGTLSFIPPQYVAPISGGSVSIETRSLSTAGTGGIMALSATDASVSWARNWGTTASPAQTYAYPSGGWLRGSRLILYGAVVDNEL